MKGTGGREIEFMIIISEETHSRLGSTLRNGIPLKLVKNPSSSDKRNVSRFLLSFSFDWEDISNTQ